MLNTSVYRLQTRLFDGYNSMIRPVMNQNMITFINADLTLLQIISMVFKSDNNFKFIN